MADQYSWFDFRIYGNKKVRELVLSPERLKKLRGDLFPESAYAHDKDYRTIFCKHEDDFTQLSTMMEYVGDGIDHDRALEALWKELTGVGLTIKGGGMAEVDSERWRFDFDEVGNIQAADIQWMGELPTVKEVKKLRDIWDTWHYPEDDNPNTVAADNPLKLKFPECGRLAKVRRIWRAEVTTDTGIQWTAPYPLENRHTVIDETSYDQPEAFYCAECGADIAKTEKELMKLIKEQRNG